MMKTNTIPYPVVLLIVALITLTTCQSKLSGTQNSKKLQVVELIPKQTYQLNGGISSIFANKSRIAFPITLPKKTISWYYQVSVSSEQQESISKDLIKSIADMIDQSGKVGLATNMVIPEEGNHYCEVYLLDDINQQLFMDKSNNFHSLPSGSRPNLVNGTIKIDDPLEGTWYIGIRNPNLNHNLTVTIEAAAIAKK